MKLPSHVNKNVKEAKESEWLKKKNPSMDHRGWMYSFICILVWSTARAYGLVNKNGGGGGEAVTWVEGAKALRASWK